MHDMLFNSINNYVGDKNSCFRMSNDIGVGCRKPERRQRHLLQRRYSRNRRRHSLSSKGSRKQQFIIPDGLNVKV